MKILGAGLAGCLAGILNPESEIHEYLSKPKQHKAVLRFRSDAISKVTGIPFKKVQVRKAIFDSELNDYVEPDPMVCNRYSMKVTGGIYERSIWNLAPAERWLAPDNFHEQMLELIGNRIVYNSNYDKKNNSEPVISTIPLPVLCKDLGIEITFRSEHHEIYVTRCTITRCDIHQTIYFPGDDSPVYRATIEGDELIVESIAEIDTVDIERVLTVFGIRGITTEVQEVNFKQKIGKFLPIDKKVRENLLYGITNRFNIYSLGRFATWRQILLDDCLKDVSKIQQMINKSHYDKMLGR